MSGRSRILSRPLLALIPLASLWLASSGSVAAADWLQFRGTDAQGAAPAENLPVDFSTGEAIAWRADLPGEGVASPIVVGDRVIVSASSGYRHDRLHVLCFDAASGSSLWERQFWATGRTGHHPTSAVAAPTPASDGEAVYVLYSSNDLVCLDLDGNLRWLRGLTSDYPTAANDVGMASSCLVVGDTVVVQVESQGESFAAGIDTASGETRWRLERPRQANWASPSVLRGTGDAPDLVLLQCSSHFSAHDPRTGEAVWSLDAACSGIPSSTAADGNVYVPAEGLTALRPSAARDQWEVLWRDNRLAPGNSSPVVYDGRIYILNRAGVLICADAANGEAVWRERLKGPFWATPVLAGGHLYCVNQDGQVQVVALGEEGKLVATNELGESILATPAVANGAMYLRSDAHLWKIGAR